MVPIDIDYLRQWVGNTETRQENLAVERAVSLALTLDKEDIPESGSVLPPLWHWAYFLPLARQSEIGADGHPKLGGFMPPVPLPRRMWVGGRLDFLKPLSLGDAITRRTEVIDVTAKSGKNGELIFVTLKHELSAHGEVYIIEEQDLVYREAEKPSDSKAAPAAATTEPPEQMPADWREHFTPDPVFLFRYSAVTFNAHRIHYDERYAREEENYPGLVVHGPLSATLLADRVEKHSGRQIRQFNFRAVRPLFCNQELRICGKQTGNDSYDVWTETPSGHIAMSASAVTA